MNSSPYVTLPPVDADASFAVRMRVPESSVAGVDGVGPASLTLPSSEERDVAVDPSAVGRTPLVEVAGSSAGSELHANAGRRRKAMQPKRFMGAHSTHRATLRHQL